MATFLQLQDKTLRACGFSTATTSDPRTRVKEAMNEWQRDYLVQPGYSRLLRDKEMTLTSVSGTAIYTFGGTVKRINGITDATNDQPLLRRDLAWLRRADPGLDQSGIPTVWVFLGQNTSGNLHIRLWPTPLGAYSYPIDYTGQIADMTEDDELPLLPEDFHDLLSLGAQHDEWLRQDDDRLEVVLRRIARKERALHRWVWDLADGTDERRDAVTPVSRLGSMFPRGT